MTSNAARGFVMLSLSNEQIMRLREKERSLREGRYLAPWELAKLFTLTTGAKSDEEVSRMENLEKQFEAKLWKQRKMEELGEIKPFSKVDEVHQWDDFVMANREFVEGMENQNENDY